MAPVEICWLNKSSYFAIVASIPGLGSEQYSYTLVQWDKEIIYSAIYSEYIIYYTITTTIYYIY